MDPATLKHVKATNNATCMQALADARSSTRALDAGQQLPQATIKHTAPSLQQAGMQHRLLWNTCSVQMGYSRVVTVKGINMHPIHPR